jgi:hypothetical protein
MPRSRDERRPGPLKLWTAVLCVALVLMATTAEAAHFHQLDALARPQQIKTSGAVTPAHGGCLLCVGAHSPGLAAPFLPVLPRSVSSEAATTPPPLRLQSFYSFALHVRPPPAR